MNRFVLANGGGQRIPLTIVGGPEAAGKTTLLRSLLTNNDGRRIAVVLDHPSVLGLRDCDIARREGNTLVLHNGCACLSLDGEIGTALSTLHSGHSNTLPDHVVVEASAIASPLRTAGYAYLPGFRPGGTVVVVSVPDVLRVRDEEVAFAPIFEAQLQHAELLILNQVDRVKTPARQVARRWLQQRTVRARMVESEQCCVPAAMILGTSLEHSPVHAVHGEWTSRYAVENDSRKSQIVQPRHENDYQAWLLTTRSPIDAGAFRSWVNTLPDSILRGDGVLRLMGERSHRFQFHRCGLRWSLTRGEPWGAAEAEPLSWISLVGFATSPITASKRRSDSGALAMPVSPEPAHFRPRLRRLSATRPIGDVT